MPQDPSKPADPLALFASALANDGGSGQGRPATTDWLSRAWSEVNGVLSQFDRESPDDPILDGIGLLVDALRSAQLELAEADESLQALDAERDRLLAQVEKLQVELQARTDTLDEMRHSSEMALDDCRIELEGLREENSSLRPNPNAAGRE